MSFNKPTDKQALQEWEEFLLQIKNSTPVDVTETEEEKAKRLKKLEADPEAWFKYYFPKYSFADPAPFHKKSTRKVMKAKRLFQSRAWARGLSKSTRRMFEIFFKTFAQKFPTNMLLISKSEDNAQRLLAPYKANLEANQRLINDYGAQERIGSWTALEFITRGNHAFRGVGADQNPRGSRVEERRPNVLVFDDVDDDQVCRNPERVEQRWKWIQEAVIPTVDIAQDYFIFFDNNIIADESCAKKAMEFAQDVEIINIRDEDGKSVWPQKNSEKDIDDMLSIISYASAQKEYFNNPIIEGLVFKNLADKPARPLKDYPFLVCYTDPSFKSGPKNDYKATSLVGAWQGEFHIIKAFCLQATVAAMVEWQYEMDAFVNGAVPVYYFIEKNVNEEEIKRQLHLASSDHGGKVLSINFDDRAKGDKFTRIEATLEPLDRNGKMFFNEKEKDNPHMKTLKGQFMALAPKSRSHDDGPDSVEGGVHIANTKLEIYTASAIHVHKRKPNKNRF